jgi:hypothetical protein
MGLKGPKPSGIPSEMSLFYVSPERDNAFVKRESAAGRQLSSCASETANAALFA